MKLFNFAIIVAAVGSVQVLASPLLVIPKENLSTPTVRYRLGHIVANPDITAGRKTMRKGPCRSNRLNQKAIEVSNIFREALGLPLIAPGGHDDGRVKILPFIGSSVSIGSGNTKGGVEHPHGPPRAHHHHHHGHHHGHHGQPRFGKGSFINRVHYSLMNLGRWEGRAVAFVLGCGIGVLLRMVFVMALVMYRAVRGRRDEEQHQYSQITIIEEVDTPKSAPPSYTDEKALIDVKIPIEVETVKAPSTTEESK